VNLAHKAYYPPTHVHKDDGSTISVTFICPNFMVAFNENADRLVIGANEFPAWEEITS
jgi:hypothetical protein